VASSGGEAGAPSWSGLVYVEYISRRSDVDLPTFHAAQQAAQRGWAAAHGEDTLLWAGARTWRLGPEPEYLVAWYSPGIGLERLDAWDAIFRSGTDDHHERPARQVSRIDVAGCYTPLLPPVTAGNGIYYAEHFALTGTLEAVRELYLRRAAGRPELTLNLLAHRIGHLAPDPGGLALWTIPGFAALTPLATDLDGVASPLALRSAGTYHDTGEEIL
jgi:hypothetical protein